MDKVDLKEKKSKEIYVFYEITKNNYTNLQKDILESLLESEYVFGEPIRTQIMNIRSPYDEIRSKFIVFQVLDELLDGIPNGADIISQTININIDAIKTECEQVIRLTPILRAQILKELERCFIDV